MSILSKSLRLAEVNPGILTLIHSKYYSHSPITRARLEGQTQTGVHYKNRVSSECCKWAT